MLPDKKQALHELFLTSLLTEQNMEDHEMVDDFEEPAYNAEPKVTNDNGEQPETIEWADTKVRLDETTVQWNLQNCIISNRTANRHTT